MFYFYSCFLFSSLTEILTLRSNNKRFSHYGYSCVSKQLCSSYPLNAKNKFTTVFENKKFVSSFGKFPVREKFFHFLENTNNYGCHGNLYEGTFARAFFRFFSVKRALKRLHLSFPPGSTAIVFY